ncbi:related to GID7 Protein involved in proteasome-dependent catabolite inactivation of fructose-1,6-bisphosphatase [Rhynchosporium graminicola]|uniref:Related to GID7 Protein involved in proteasome-dependent catabolite inactivation of fructose-1,6-bisphosphatase n=1 Tax=Rhynchosporium graminicola TaxID=2792576 RepID=A0A1E1KNG0_9HELO|nr:related to GID7 Protein involved in proteasome-dependent catabolite inactivation of fructose-1,6-bisphosphatase [Rhynchosporium commune]
MYNAGAEYVPQRHRRSQPQRWILRRHYLFSRTTSGNPAAVVLADDRRPSISLITTDDPSIPTNLLQSSSTIISAPTPPINPQTRETLQQQSSSSASSLAAGPPEPPFSLAQILGRRQRVISANLEEEEGGYGGLGILTPSVSTYQLPPPKRRRQGSRMRLEGESNSSNGTSRPFSNGSGPSALHKAALSNSANGTRRSSIAINGSITNGHSSVKQPPTYFGHDREEVTRILIQSLTDLGYNSAAASLSQESGFYVESPTVAKFRNAVLTGEWSQAESLLFGGSLEDGGVSIDGDGLVLQDGVDRNVMRFWLRQQKFLELLEQRDTGRALMVLRTELTPLYQDTGKLHFLSRMHIALSNVTRTSISSASQPSKKVPDRQLSLPQHFGITIIVPRPLGSFEVLQNLAMAESGIASVSWSPNDEFVVTCGRDHLAILWDSHTGDILHQLPRFGEPVSSCVWAPDGRTFIIGCLDKEKNLSQWNRNGDLVFDWGRTHRIQDVEISPNGQYLVAMDNETHIHIYNFVTRELEYEMDMKVRMSSVSISQDSRFLLVNKTDGEAQMVDLDVQAPIRTFKSGAKGGNFVIRATYGGANESFVIFGSEDGHIFIWHKETGQLIEKLEGHGKASCNSVSWNPSNPCMFATAGDDAKVRIWADVDQLEQCSTGSNFQRHSNGR